MIEPAMYLGIGFLLASLLGIVFIPLVHARAVRLTMRRLEASTPLSMAEIQADKDQLRAEFAMSTRRLEMSVDQLKAKTTSQLAELGKKTDAINRLKVELGDKTATIFALEAREKSLKEQIRTTEEEYAVKTSALRETERSLADKEAELARLSAELGEHKAENDGQRVELIALKTQIDALKLRIEDYEREIKTTEERLQREREEVARATNELNAERSRVQNLATRVSQLEQQLARQTEEAENFARRVQELEGRVADQGRLLTERDFECETLRKDLGASRQSETNLREEIASLREQHNEATATLRHAKEQLEKELAQVRADRTKLEHDIAAMKRDAESSWAAERVENALLRERINDIAAEVTKLAVVLEGPNSPIETLLGAETGTARAAVKGVPVQAEAGKAKPASPAQAPGNLADRMRALQSRASRLSPTT
jgi:chromosome segregation ATPase